MSRPKLCAVVAWRLNSVQRSSLHGEPQAAGHLPAGGEAGLGLEPLVEVDRILQHLGDRGRGAQLADEAGGMPGRAAGQLALLEQDDVGLVVAGQMIGGRAADDAAADDDDLRRGPEGRASCFPIFALVGRVARGRSGRG